MPVIFNREEEIMWLDPIVDYHLVNQYLLPYSEKDMEIYPISTLVNSPKNDTADIVKPYR
jgi:putative SOS response-associated peptidase YedK